GFVASLAPMSLARHERLLDSLKSGQQASPPKSALRVWLLASQAAFCMMLLAGSGLFLQSLRRATTVDRGFDVDRLIEVDLSGLGLSMANPPLVESGIERLQSLPGVEVVGGAAYWLGNPSGTYVRLSGHDSIPREQLPAFN